MHIIFTLSSISIQPTDTAKCSVLGELHRPFRAATSHALGMVHIPTERRQQVLHCWNPKHFSPHKSQPHRGNGEQDSKHGTTYLNADKSKHIHWTHSCITPVCSSFKKHWKTAGSILQCFVSGIVTQTLTNQHCAFLQIRLDYLE